MFVPLPNLDDRRWTDLVDEGRSLIPVYAPGWTDHNVSDPGITLMELLAWIADSDIYRANRVPDAHLLAFLALVGLRPAPPIAARTAVQFVLAKGAAKLLLPATTELDAKLLNGKKGKFCLEKDVWALPAAIQAVQALSGGKFRDVSGDWSHGKPIAAFGPNPQPGDAFYLGFDGSLAAADVLSLWIELAGPRATAAERQRILDELLLGQQTCGAWNPCGTQTASPNCPVMPPHHSVVLAWEAQTRAGVWLAVDVLDDTRSMTLSGAVTLTLPADVAPVRTGAVPQALRYLRCRFVSGSFDEAPELVRVLENAAEAEQSSPAWEQWTIAPGVIAMGTPPAPSHLAWLQFTFDGSGRIASLDFSDTAEGAIGIVVLAYKPSTDTLPGSLIVESIRIGTGTGAPNQLLTLNGGDLVTGSFQVYTIELRGPIAWAPVESFVSSCPADANFVLDAGAAQVLFGDGQNGRAPMAGSPILAIARVTGASAGNVAAGAVDSLDLGPHNAAVLGDPAGAAVHLESIANPDAAKGGAEQETIAHTEGRAAQLLDRPERAVTLGDCEALALETPGTSIARAAAVANYCAGLQCYSAPGFITVVIVPYLPSGQPVPSSGLIGAVKAYLNRRKVIGTRVEVTGPDYLEVTVTASVKALAGQSKTAVSAAVVAALQQFLDPLTGGPDGTGWPLGRGVYVSEVLQMIADVPGVDHVTSLALEADGCGKQCGNVCLNPLALTVSGSHQIQVS
jgi:hypothetical protein